MNSLNHLFRTLGQAFCRCATRFPVTTVFAFALTAFLCYLTATEATQASGKLLMTLGYYFSTGTLLSLSLHLWGEEVKPCFCWLLQSANSSKARLSYYALFRQKKALRLSHNFRPLVLGRFAT